MKHGELMEVLMCSVSVQNCRWRPNISELLICVVRTFMRHLKVFGAELNHRFMKASVWMPYNACCCISLMTNRKSLNPSLYDISAKRTRNNSLLMHATSSSAFQYSDYICIPPLCSYHICRRGAECEIFFSVGRLDNRGVNIPPR